jgi:hypothetical protein
MALSAWRSTQSDGTLPNEKRAAQMQFRRFLSWSTDVFDWGIASRDGVGKFKIQINHGDSLIFEQEVELTLRLVTLGMTGLIFYSWQFLREEISTTRIGPEVTNTIPEGIGLTPPIKVINTASMAGAVEDASNHRLTAEELRSVGSPSWLRTLGGAGPTSEFGTLVPGAGGGSTDREVIVEAWWESSVYKLTVPVGAKLKVVRDAWGLGASTRPEWQFRFLEGARLVDGAFGPFGELVAARPLAGDGGLQGGHGFAEYGFFDGRGWIAGASDPSLVMLPDGREILGVLQNDGYWEYESRNTQRQWTKVRYPGEEPGTTQTLPLFDGEIIMPQLIRLENGTRLAIGISDGRIVVRRSSDGGVGDLIDVGDAGNEESVALDKDASGAVYIVGGSGTALYQSSNGGARFEPMAQLVEA